jgi:hypothetical protein
MIMSARKSCGPTDLYRHFDANGTLLYVGISLSAIGRLQAHKGSSHWSNNIARVTIENFPTREMALAAEVRAIQSERPLHNVVHAGQASMPTVPKEFDAAYTSDGSVVLAKVWRDEEGDPIVVTFSPGREVEFCTRGMTYFMLHADALREIADLSDAAEEWHTLVPHAEVSPSDYPMIARFEIPQLGKMFSVCRELDCCELCPA